MHLAGPSGENNNATALSIALFVKSIPHPLHSEYFFGFKNLIWKKLLIFAIIRGPPVAMLIQPQPSPISLIQVAPILLSDSIANMGLDCRYSCWEWVELLLGWPGMLDFADGT
jgi:hypothetical protein